jgi:serpin B
MLRRELLRAAALGAAGLGVGAGCAPAGQALIPVAGAAGQVAAARLHRLPADPAELTGGARAVGDFGAALFRRVAAGQPDGNLALSPYSVAVALAMTRAGAGGRTAAELDIVLRAAAVGAGADALPSAFNALTQHVDGLAGPRRLPGGSSIDVVLDAANGVWAQPAVSWRGPFLARLARYYGAGLRLADFSHDPDGATRAINSWTSQRTDGGITDLFGPGDLTVLTRLVLVNALRLKAPWDSSFPPAAPGPFTRADGVVVRAELMSTTLDRVGYAAGPGWRAVDLPYLGRDLALAVVVPDPGRFAGVRAGFDGAGLRALLAAMRVSALQVTLPRFTVRTHTSLNDVLSALGMPTAFTDGADFSAMTTEFRLKISQVVHEVTVAVDERGTEATAATGVAMEMLALAVPDVPPLVADRPFLFVLHDMMTGTPLFLGQVLDPTAG